MQGIHGILGSGAGGGSGGPIFGDRRLRAAPPGQQLQQAIKCPRCDSSNTKFCYYNNYNLSQPRHFCKNCRRYWTNGGVLRNVPVGGGCRKAKRSSKRKAASPAPLHRPPPPTAANDRHNKSNSRSSSESTSANTAANARSAGGVADGVGSSGKGAVVTESCSESFSSPLFKFTEQLPATYTVQDPAKPDCSVANTNLKPLIDPGRVAQANSSGGAIFSEIGGFASFMSGDQSENPFGFGAGGDVAPTPFRIHHQNQVNHHHLMRNSTAEIWPMEKMDGGDHWGAAGVLDQTVQTDLLPSSRSTGGGVLAGSVWHGISGGERSNIGNLFDLTTASSSAHGGHWSQSADQWHESDHDHDQHLYLPP